MQIKLNGNSIKFNKKYIFFIFYLLNFTDAFCFRTAECLFQAGAALGLNERMLVTITSTTCCRTHEVVLFQLIKYPLSPCSSRVTRCVPTAVFNSKDAPGVIMHASNSVVTFN